MTGRVGLPSLLIRASLFRSSQARIEMLSQPKNVESHAMKRDEIEKEAIKECSFAPKVRRSRMQGGRVLPSPCQISESLPSSISPDARVGSQTGRGPQRHMRQGQTHPDVVERLLQ